MRIKEQEVDEVFRMLDDHSNTHYECNYLKDYPHICVVLAHVSEEGAYNYNTLFIAQKYSDGRISCREIVDICNYGKDIHIKSVTADETGAIIITFDDIGTCKITKDSYMGELS